MFLLLRLTTSVCEAMTSPAMPYIKVGMPRFITFSTLGQSIYPSLALDVVLPVKVVLEREILVLPPADVILDEREGPGAENMVVGSINLGRKLEPFISLNSYITYLPVEVTHTPLVVKDISSRHIPG